MPVIMIMHPVTNDQKLIGGSSAMAVRDVLNGIRFFWAMRCCWSLGRVSRECPNGG